MDYANNVKLAMVGCGNFSDILAVALQQSRNAELVTCFDISPAKCQDFSNTYQCEQEKSYQSLLKRKDIDGIVLVTPNNEHSCQAILASQYKKHIFVEKPIANTITDAKQMIDAYRKSGLVLMVGHLRRRSAGIRKIKKLLMQGVIGDPVMVEATVSTDSGFNLTPEKFRWHGDDLGCPGGALMTSGIHHVDTLRYFFGPIESVSAHFQKLYIKADVEDVNTAIFKFKSGVMGYLGTTYAPPYDNWIYIHGTQAKLLWKVSLPIPPTGKYLHNRDEYTKLTLFGKGKRAQEIPFAFGDPVSEEIDEFARCIQTGERPETDGEKALEALAFVRAAIDSASSGTQVRLTV